jgi:hypothetical protein
MTANPNNTHNSKNQGQAPDPLTPSPDAWREYFDEAGYMQDDYLKPGYDNISPGGYRKHIDPSE